MELRQEKPLGMESISPTLSRRYRYTVTLTPSGRLSAPNVESQEIPASTRLIHGILDGYS